MDARRGLVVGETLVDMFPTGPGSLTEVEGFRHRPGGAPANVAVGLARLDAAPLFWTRLGDDLLGTYLADRLADFDVPDRFVVREDGSKTALALVVPADGDQTFAFYEAGSALAFEQGTVPEETLSDREWLHLGGVPLAHPTGRDAVLDAAGRARDAGATVTFDPNTRPDLFDGPAAAERALRDALAVTDVLFCSPDDLVPLDVSPERARAAPEAVAADLLECGPHTVFLTRGEQGATVVTESTTRSDRVARSVPAFDVDAVDTTGAGDAFTAAVLSRYEPRGTPDRLDEVLRFACATASLATTATGAMPSLPGEDEVEAFLERRR